MWVNVYEDENGRQFLAHIASTRELAISVAEREARPLGKLVARLKLNFKRGDGLTIDEMSQLSEG